MALPPLSSVVEFGVQLEEQAEAAREVALALQDFGWCLVEAGATPAVF